MQTQRMTWLVFAIIFNAEGKHYLTGKLKAAEIMLLVCFEVRFAEESHVPVPQGQAGCQRRCRAGPCLPGREPWVLAPPRRLLVRAAVGVGGQGALRALAGWEAWWWPNSNSQGLPLKQTPVFVVLTVWEARQCRLVKSVPLKRP